MCGTVHNNFNVTPVLDNKFFWYNYDGNKRHIDNLFFSLFYPNIGEERKRKLCWTDITNLATGNLLSINQLNTILGDSDRAVEGYRYLNAAVKKAKNTFSDGVLSSMPFFDFINGKIKNSKTFRRIMMSSNEALTKKQPRDPITNFIRILGQDRHDDDLARVNLKQLNSLWTKHFIQSDFRTYLFKLYHNILGLNIRVAHINPVRDPSCFFCLKSGNLPAVRESYSHFFWFCPTTQGIIKRFFDSFLTIDCSCTAMHLDCYQKDNKLVFSLPLAIVCGLLKFVLCNFKLRKRLPTWPSVVSDFFFIFSSMIGASRTFEDDVNRCNLFKRNNIF
jgi:hypothetical protein